MAAKKTAKKTAKKAPAKGKVTPKGQLSRFQVFEMKRINRKAIKNAPYNPRQLDSHAKSRLELFLKKRGLLAPITVNRRTGFIVGGHQRLAALDALEGHPDYLLDVAMVNLDDAAERESNIFLNNPGAQGTWDEAALATMLKETPGLDLEMTGFVPMDLQVMFDDPSLGGLYDADSDVAAELDKFDEIVEASRAKPKVDKAEKKAERKQWDKGYDEAKIEAPYTIVIWANHEERSRFYETVGFPADERHIDGQLVLARLKA
jgi:hypothetical protein